jgi:carbohydrate kinase (thermoresistant glucokinase family)
MIVVVMGVSGVGKTTVGERLAARLGADFLEGDRFHPAANIAKMSSGVPLDDADRRPWLEALATELDRFRRRGAAVVLTCSALRESYRAILRGRYDDVAFVFLDGTKTLVQGRLAARRGHFMPPGLLDSQFAALEAPEAAEPAIRVDVDATPEAIVEAVLQRLVLQRPGGATS